MSLLNDELETRVLPHQMASKENRPRILITGSPIVFPNFKLPLLIEEMGGALVADETCMGERGMYRITSYNVCYTKLLRKRIQHDIGCRYSQDQCV